MQRIPQVSRADVERVVDRDYPAADRANVLAILDAYGNAGWESGGSRVHLALLKLADGNADELRRHVAVAKMDARDVVAAAEYPSAFLQMPSPGLTTTGEHQRAYDSDWDQYRKWLERGRTTPSP